MRARINKQLLKTSGTDFLAAVKMIVHDPFTYFDKAPKTEIDL